MKEMMIIKRSGQEVAFDKEKIASAIRKANKEVGERHRISEAALQAIVDVVAEECATLGRSPHVEEIQDMVENRLMATMSFALARKYITYRYNRALVRKVNTTDAQILSLIECNNEEVKQENSNKNPTVNSVQRDYMAGEVSKDLTRRILLPADIVAAHDQGGIFLRAFFMDRHLDFRKGHNKHFDAAAAEGQLPRQVQHLLLGPVRGIGIGMEMDTD